MDSYKVFLRKLHDELVQCISEAENLEFHHCEVMTTQYLHYSRLVTMISHLEQRMVHYGRTKGYIEGPGQGIWSPAVPDGLEFSGRLGAGDFSWSPDGSRSLHEHDSGREDERPDDLEDVDLLQL